MLNIDFILQSGGQLHTEADMKCLVAIEIWILHGHPIQSARHHVEGQRILCQAQVGTGARIWWRTQWFYLHIIATDHECGLVTHNYTPRYKQISSFIDWWPTIVINLRYSSASIFVAGVVAIVIAIINVIIQHRFHGFNQTIICLIAIIFHSFHLLTKIIEIYLQNTIQVLIIFQILIHVVAPY